MPQLFDHLPFPLAQGNVLAYFENNRPGLRCIVVRCAAVRTKDGAWQSALWSARGVPIEDPLPEPVEFTYPGFALRQERVGLQDFASLLAELHDPGRLIGISGKVDSVP